MGTTTTAAPAAAEHASEPPCESPVSCPVAGSTKHSRSFAGEDETVAFEKGTNVTTPDLPRSSAFVSAAWRPRPRARPAVAVSGSEAEAAAERSNALRIAFLFGGSQPRGGCGGKERVLFATVRESGETDACFLFCFFCFSLLAPRFFFGRRRRR